MCTHHNKEVINKLNITIFKSCWQNHLENKIQKLAFQGPVTKKVSPLNTLHWFSLLRAQQRRLLWCLGICTTSAFILFNLKMVLLSKPMFPMFTNQCFQCLQTISSLFKLPSAFWFTVINYWWFVFVFIGSPRLFNCYIRIWSY